MKSLLDILPWCSDLVMGKEEHTLVATDEYVKALAGRVKDLDVIELGVGTGVLTQLLLDGGARSVTGYEILPDVCKVQDSRFKLVIEDYTTIALNKEPLILGKEPRNVCLVSNPAYSTLPAIVSNILPHIKNAILMIPGRCRDEFKALGFRELFALTGDAFEPKATGLHYVVARGFETPAAYVPKFIDLTYEVSKLRTDTIPERVKELEKSLPSVALCGLGGFPIVRVPTYQDGLRWCGEKVTPEMLKKHFLEALGLSAVLTYTNKKNKSLVELGQICADRKEAWAYHWVTATIVLAGHSPAVHLAFAHDTRFKLGWAVEKEYSGQLLGVFTASAGISEWLKFTSKKDDISFDTATRKAMAECHDLLKEILP